MIYLDNAATTRVSKEVIIEINNYYAKNYFNASSNHLHGKETGNAIEKARNKVANLLNCKNREVFFTSGATEGINTILRGYVEANIEKGQHIITTKTEHNAVLETCSYLDNIGIDITYLDVDKNGLININELKKSIQDNTLLVSILWINNETGVMQDIATISRIVAKTKAKLFVDATQAVGKIPIDVNNLNIDMLCLSAHKFHGPKGVGALFIRQNTKITSLLHGGGQENGFRSGTSNVPGIVGLGKSCDISNVDTSKIKTVMLYLERRLKEEFNCYVIAEKTPRSPYITNIIFANIDAEIIIGKLKKTMISTGSACTSKITEPSHVLTAMGIDAKQSFSSLRFSISKYTTLNEIDSAIKELGEVI